MAKQPTKTQLQDELASLQDELASLRDAYAKTRSNEERFKKELKELSEILHMNEKHTVNLRDRLERIRTICQTALTVKFGFRGHQQPNFEEEEEFPYSHEYRFLVMLIEESLSHGFNNEYSNEKFLKRQFDDLENDFIERLR